MSELVSLTKDGDIAVITINNPPVNALSPGVPEGIKASVEAAEKDSAIKGIVLIGGGRTFIAGADIKEFGKITSGAKDRGVGLNPVLDTLEELPEADRVRDSRHGLWRRAGNGHGLPLSRGRAQRAGRPARVQAGDHSRRRRHAALAAPGRSGSRG